MTGTILTDLNFYLKCARPLIFALPRPEDRGVAAAWLKRLTQDTSIPDTVKNSYLKLLICFLLKKKLGGPFSKHPNSFQTLPQSLKDQEAFSSKSVEVSQKEQPYSTDFSGDLCAYVVFQDIEDFGTHCYYAASRQPLTTWQGFDRSLFPEGIKPGGVKTMELEDEVLDDGESEDLDAIVVEKKPSLREKTKVALGLPLIGKKPRPEDDRIPPSWGTNLLLATDLDDE